VADVLLSVEGVVDVQDGAPGIAEDVFHALVFQELDYDLATAELHVLGLLTGSFVFPWTCPRG